MGKARGNVRRDWLKPYRFPAGFRDGANQRSPFLGEVAQGGHISMVSHARNDGGGDARDERPVPEVFPGMDVGEMNFHGGQG